MALLRVKLKNPDLLKRPSLLRHPAGLPFMSADAEVSWPDDQYTRRRIQDGDVEVVQEQAAAPTSEDPAPKQALEEASDHPFAEISTDHA